MERNLMKSKLTKAEKKVMLIEAAIVLGCFVSVIISARPIMNGSIFALVGAVILVAVACIVSDDIERIWRASHNR